MDESSAKRFRSDDDESAPMAPGDTVIPFGEYKSKRLSEVPSGFVWMLSECSVEGARPEYSIKTPKISAIHDLQQMLWVFKFHEPLALAARRFLYEERDQAFTQKTNEMHRATVEGCCGKCKKTVPVIDRRAAPSRKFHDKCLHELLMEEQTLFGYVRNRRVLE
jgi:hypothetical protein